MYQILIAEDEPRIVSFLEKGLRANGFHTSTTADAGEAVGLVLTGAFNLLLLDLGLPKKDGLDILEELRGQGVKIPIIILTARDDVRDKVRGLKEGADDYMTKPFHFEELLARIRLRLKPQETSEGNLNGNQASTVLKAGQLVMDLRTRIVKVDQQEVEFPSREFSLLEVFVRHPGQVITREQLLDQVWGYDYDPGSNIVDVYVGHLRKKLPSKLIETVRGVGYRLRV
ncbi:MAG: response regulator transcription factor [Oscillatoriales cyanobacterium RM1_1_9]|nr:response regulator transcription factor [Oscillatoriales cyanobacterium SM2_3_0]NJO45675.1 response regulator transcription factor [Oscillatoriales cyanobacterium RM2_1_1]NJO70531.1 response regulator transcription factor [Oscillatoriales cyanobacterium RM1_1_9]